MNYTIIIKPLAEQEIREAKAWYTADKERVGNEFINAVDQILKLIQRNPKLFAIRYRGVRMGIVKRFPYAVHYLIEGKKVIVLSVMHTRRKPKE